MLVVFRFCQIYSKTYSACANKWRIQALFSFKIFLDLSTVALLFVFDNYCLTMD
jgi:hypothetical protein